MKNGDTYYTFWKEGFCGPFIYNNESNINIKSTITGERDSLSEAALAFKLIYGTWNHESEYDYVVRVASMVDHDNINDYIDTYPLYEKQLTELKKYSERVAQIVHG